MLADAQQAQVEGLRALAGRRRRRVLEQVPAQRLVGRVPLAEERAGDLQLDARRATRAHVGQADRVDVDQAEVLAHLVGDADRALREVDDQAEVVEADLVQDVPRRAEREVQVGVGEVDQVGDDAAERHAAEADGHDLVGVGALAVGAGERQLVEAQPEDVAGAAVLLLEEVADRQLQRVRAEVGAERAHDRAAVLGLGRALQVDAGVELEGHRLEPRRPARGGVEGVGRADRARARVVGQRDGADDQGPEVGPRRRQAERLLHQLDQVDVVGQPAAQRPAAVGRAVALEHQLRGAVAEGEGRDELARSRPRRPSASRSPGCRRAGRP